MRSTYGRTWVHAARAVSVLCPHSRRQGGKGYSIVVESDLCGGGVGLAVQGLATPRRCKRAVVVPNLHMLGPHGQQPADLADDLLRVDLRGLGAEEGEGLGLGRPICTMPLIAQATPPRACIVRPNGSTFNLGVPHLVIPVAGPLQEATERARVEDGLGEALDALVDLYNAHAHKGGG